MSEAVRDALVELQDRIGAANEKSGFNQATEVPEELRYLYWANNMLLVVSELIEAHDELRKGKEITEEYLSYPPVPASLAVDFPSGGDATEYWESQNVGKPEGAPSEIADAVIRLFGICYEADIDLGAVILQKLTFNEQREFMHGGKKF